MTDRFPSRIVCLTEETTETLYLFGEQDRIIGISGFTVRPPQARKEKPKVSAFTSANIDKIIALNPDLVLGFSDLQADIAVELIRLGIPVHIFNQRSIEEILNMIVQLGALVGALEQALRWVRDFEQKASDLKTASSSMRAHPTVYFEEWPDPIISGIQWVSELIELSGGQDCFPDNSQQALAKYRIIADPLEVVRRQPDIIIGSWCGRKFRSAHVAARPGWDDIPAVKSGHLYEIKSAYILQPGPAALTDGLSQILDIITSWQNSTLN